VGNPLLPTVITALKEIAKLETSVFELEVDVIIGEFAIKQVLRQDVDVGCVSLTRLCKELDN
jgi:hypothetical protein